MKKEFNSYNFALKENFSEHLLRQVPLSLENLPQVIFNQPMTGSFSTSSWWSAVWAFSKSLRSMMNCILT